MLFKLLLITLFVEHAMPAAKKCEYGWYHHANKCYYFLGHQYTYTYDDARYECHKHYGSQLAQIKSEDEQKFIETIFKDGLMLNNVWLGKI